MKYNKSAKEVICFFLAFLIAFFTIQINFSVPNEETQKKCEIALQQYLDAPLNHFSNDIKISIKDAKITATQPFSFVFATAKLNSEGIYEFETRTYLLVFVFTQIILIVLLACLLYAILIGVTTISAVLFKKTSEYLKYSFCFVQKAIKKIYDYFHKKRLQKQLKEYETPEYQRIYQIGYNAGYANGFADGSLEANTLRPDC